MSAESIRELKGRHVGETVYVVASGASLNFMDAEFFDDQIVVAVNDMWRHIPATFVCAHHHEQLQAAIDAGQCVVTSDRDWGGPGWGTPVALTGDFYTYRTGQNRRDGHPSISDAHLMEDTQEQLVVSPCTTSEALQFAAHLGAATILCCGLDGAALDGRWNCFNYNIDQTGQSAGTNPQHVRLTQPIIRQTIAALRAKGVRVYSVSPFIGWDHEGHVYTPAPVLEGRALLDALHAVNYQALAGVS